MGKTVGIICERATSAAFFARELRELLDEQVSVSAYCLEDNSIRQLRRCDLYLNLVTSYESMKAPWARDCFPPEDQTIRAKVSFTWESIAMLKQYPSGTRAILSNQNRHMAMECISQLYDLGVSNIEFFPYGPEMGELPPERLAFVLGPSELGNVEFPVVDIGMRRLSVSTIYELALKLGLSKFLRSKKFAAYSQALAETSYPLSQMAYENLAAEVKLDVILNTLDTGVVCVSESDIVTQINRQAQILLGVGCEVLEQPAAECLPGVPLTVTPPDAPKLLNLRGQEISAAVTVLKSDGTMVGKIILLHPFEEEENRQTVLRMQKGRKKHQPRYTFDDIVGSSPSITKAKEIAQRMAKRDAAVLITGESGTGKELFAQAIHNASPRRDKPFVAVNCAALTETLLESELFGYVDGAFTGAKKGGKLGFFEYAHQGTLFLDEIEAMSTGLQAKLLRVLQEREVVRIGSVSPIPVDVRVLSSTNEDLLRRVDEGSFRRDLYYRLNVIPLHLPSLKERREDIFPLVEVFCRQVGAHFTMTENARIALLQHRWPGNIRELRNCVEYLHNMEVDVIDIEDLPEQFQAITVPRQMKDFPSAGDLRPNAWRLMGLLGHLYPERKGVGRQGMVRLCAQKGFSISEHEVRLALQELEGKSYIVISRGRGGTQLTETGYQKYLELSSL